MTTLNNGFSRMQHDDEGAVRTWVVVIIATTVVAIILTITWAIAGDTVSAVLRHAIERMSVSS